MKTQNQTLFGIKLRELTLLALLGAVIPFAFLFFLILAARDPFETWMFLPMSLIPMGGAAAGVFFYPMAFKWSPRGNQKLITVIFSTLLYFIAVWMSAIIAFSITGHWD